MNKQSESHMTIQTACHDVEPASLAMLQNLVAASRTGRDKIDEIVIDAIKKFDPEVESFSYYPSKVPVVGEFATQDVMSSSQERCLIGKIKGKGTGRSLILFAHPDVEPAGTGAQWSTDPFTPYIREGKLYGWGVADDLAGMAIMLQTAAILKSNGIHLQGDLVVVSAPSKSHRRGIAAALHHGVTGDGALYLHPAESGRGLDEIKAFSPGQLEFEIVIKGRPPTTLEPAHTAFAHRAVNPFDKAMIVAKILQEIGSKRGSSIHHPRLEEAIGRSVNLMITRCEFGDRESPSRIPAECRLFGSLSLVPAESIKSVMAQVEEDLLDGASNDPWLAEHPPVLTWLAAVSAAETPGSHALYKLATRELERLGAAPRVNPLHTASDIRNPIVQKTIPTVGFGPRCGGLTMSGFADEWVDIDDFYRAISASVSIIVNWCGKV